MDKVKFKYMAGWAGIEPTATQGEFTWLDTAFATLKLAGVDKRIFLARGAAIGAMFL